MSGELATFLTAMTPVGELRAAIPLALGVYKMPVLSAFIWSVAGNILAAALVLYFVGPISDYLSARWTFHKRFLEYLFSRTRKKFNHTRGAWGSLALIIFVAIPLPMTGGWSGALAAYLFGIPFRQALALISIGIFIAGLLVSGASVGILNAFFKY